MFALLEGASFVVLLFIAMPLKYLGNLPYAVRVVGWIHGLLFILFCAALWNARKQLGMTVACKVLAAGLLPFGPLFMDRRLRDEQD